MLNYWHFIEFKVVLLVFSVPVGMVMTWYGRDWLIFVDFHESIYYILFLIHCLFLLFFVELGAQLVRANTWEIGYFYLIFKPLSCWFELGLGFWDLHYFYIFIYRWYYYFFVYTALIYKILAGTWQLIFLIQFCLSLFWRIEWRVELRLFIFLMSYVTTGSKRFLGTSFT